MEISRTNAPAIPPRRLTPTIVTPPVPSRWERCKVHPNNKYVAVCKTCIAFLCNECMADDTFDDHVNCKVSYLDVNLFTTCEELTSKLVRKLENTTHTMSAFHKSLTRKRERMLKKRNETVAEIERYYNRLKDRFMQKLKREENALLNHLNEKVSEQDDVINKHIEQCDNALGVIGEKKNIVTNIAVRLCGGQHGKNTINFLKNIVKASHDIEWCSKSKADIEAARNAFLVIRLAVDSEKEEAILNSNVASVEVLNSRSEDQGSGNLEVEGINEASHHVVAAVSEVQEADIEMEGESVDLTEVLRVALPDTPAGQATGSSPMSSRPPSVFAASDSACHAIVEDQAAPSSTCDAPIDIPILQIETLRDIAYIDNVHDGQAGLDTSNAHVSNDCNIQRETLDVQTSGYGQAEMGEAASASRDQARASSTSPHASSSTSSTPESPVNEENTSVDNGNDAADGTDTTAVIHSVENNETVSVSQSPAPASPTDETEDDPPPPYPGFPRFRPGPNEQPPPYPGPPPPPYTQHPPPPRALQAGRSRLNAHSGDSGVAQAMASLEISPVSQSSPACLKGLKIISAFSVNEVQDKRSSGIFALAIVRDNSFVVVDRWNKKLKYFNSAGNSCGGLIFREEPWDVTIVSPELVTVTVPKLNTLYKIKVTDQSVITTSTVSTFRRYACVSYQKTSEMYICGQVPQFGEPVIDVISINGGPILQSFRQDSDTRNRCVFSYPRYVKVTDDGIVIVCDWNLKCLLLFKLDGSFVGRYKGTVDFPLNEPTGIAYNGEKKEVYVIDSKHNSLSSAIHTVSLDCECKEIIRWDNELRMAPAISPCGRGFAVGSKSGVVSIFRPTSRRRQPSPIQDEPPTR